MDAKETALRHSYVHTHIQVFRTAQQLRLLGYFVPFGPPSLVIYYFAMMNQKLKSKGHRMGG